MDASAYTQCDAVDQQGKKATYLHLLGGCMRESKRPLSMQHRYGLIAGACDNRFSVRLRVDALV